MPANIGNQIITLKFYDEVTTANVNRRFKDLRPLGVYHGGHLSRIDDTHVSVSPVVCEIGGGGDHQVRGELQDTIPSIVVATVTPYVVLRWQYTGDAAQDYMAILGVSTPASTDLVLGAGTYAGSVMTGISYVDRSNPSIVETFLKVEPRDTPDMLVYVCAGRYKTDAGAVDIPHSVVGAFAAPLVQDKIFLVYIDHATGSIGIDSSGDESLTPVAPLYAGRVVIAEVTLTPTTTQITGAEIRDTRTFMDKVAGPDNVTIQINGSGQLEVLDPPAGWPGFGALDTLDSLGSPLVKDVVYRATSDGFVCGTGYNFWAYMQAGLTSNPTYQVAVSRYSSNNFGCEWSCGYPVSSGEYIRFRAENFSAMWFKSIGATGKLVKQ